MGGPPTGAGALVGQQLGKYDLLALLALGGTAEIYLARIDGTSGFEKYVVVKCLHDHLAEDAEFVSMFLDEARLGAQLDHSNIVQTLALGEHEGRYYLVMEFIAGLSLALVGRRATERVRGGKVPVAIVLNTAAQACAGLHYAHDRVENLVHRDISPQNLVITYEGIVKLVDFGIAKAEYRETKTRAGTVKGKFAYMSPEQCQAGIVDRRTDVFALGVITWELLTGRRLFKRDSTYETYQAVVACEVPQPSAVNHELDPALDALLMKALAKDKEHRYPTAEAFGESLMGYLHHRGKPSGPNAIGQFFEECFQQEVDEHYARMRELIEGRRKSVAEQKLLQWDASELDGSASVMEIEEISAVMEESESVPRATMAAQMSAAPGGNVGPVSPPMSRARHAALEPAAPVDRPRVETLPVRKYGRGDLRAPTPTPTPTDPVAAEDDFESGLETDAEADLPGENTRIEEHPMDSLAAMRRATTAEPLRRGATGNDAKKAAPPPRKVLTPPGLRAGGAPLDPLPGERVEMLASSTPPPSQVPPPRFIEAPTMIAPEARAAAAPPGGRFAEVPTVLDPRILTPPGTPRFADAKTVVPVLMPSRQAVENPATGTGQTQMLEPGDLIEADATNPLMPRADVMPASPQAVDLVSMPPPAEAFAHQPYYVHLAEGGEPRRFPPWALGVMFVIVLALATGITVAIARAVS